MKHLLIDHTMAKEVLIAEDKWAGSHGIVKESGYLGTSLLYYTLCYMLPAKTAVILGSGDGLVPRFIRQAQKEVPDEAFVEHSRCILIDADRDVHHFGAPTYHTKDKNFFTASFPDIEIWKITTDEAIGDIQRNEIRIDYLHIDADHTFHQSLNDFENYLPLMSEDFIITLHDTAINHLEGWKDGCVPRTIAYLRQQMQEGGKYAHLEMINFNMRKTHPSHYFSDKMKCCGTAIIKPKVESSWDRAYKEAPWLTGNI